MGSTTAFSWPGTLTPDTVLLSDATSNPAFYNYIHVFVPYCSSDTWLGDREASADSGGYYFLGTRIVEAVVETLLRPSSPALVVMGGESAGGVGAVGQLNRVKALLPGAPVYALSDSSWFTGLAMAADLNNSFTLWNASYDPSCTSAQSSAPQVCILLATVVEYLEAPAFFLVPMYDVFNAFGTVDPSAVQPNASNNRRLTFGGGQTRNSLEDATNLAATAANLSFFSPSCAWHVLMRPVADSGF